MQEVSLRAFNLFILNSFLSLSEHFTETLEIIYYLETRFIFGYLLVVSNDRNVLEPIGTELS